MPNAAFVLLILAQANGLLLMGLWLFRWVGRPQTGFGLNRIVLAMLPLASILLPIVAFLPWRQSLNPVFNLGPTVALPEISITADTPENQWPGDWFSLCLAFYFIISGCMFLRWLWQTGQVIWLWRNSPKQSIEGRTVALTTGRWGSFVWGPLLFWDETLAPLAPGPVWHHERAHQRLGHGIDLALARVATILLWPGAFFGGLLPRVREVLETQADAAALRHGYAPRAYQALLLQAVLRQYPAVGQAFAYRSLTHRLSMLNPRKVPAWRRWLAVLPVVALLGAAPFLAHAQTEPAATRTRPQTAARPPAAAPTDEGTMPNPGYDLATKLSQSLQYPAAARADSIQGRVVLRFTVAADGHIGNINVLHSLRPDCDQAAIAAVRALPPWQPARKPDGTPHAAEMTLPILFQLR